MIRPVFKPSFVLTMHQLTIGDFLSHADYPGEEFRFLSSPDNFNTLSLLKMDGNHITIEATASQVTFLRKSPLRFFPVDRPLYYKKRNQTNWFVGTWYYPSPVSPQEDKLLIYQSTDGILSDELDYVPILDVIPDDQRQCKCGAPVHHKFNNDCPKCRWYICRSCSSCGCHILDN